MCGSCTIDEAHPSVVHGIIYLASPAQQGTWIPAMHPFTFLSTDRRVEHHHQKKTANKWYRWQSAVRVIVFLSVSSKNDWEERQWKKKYTTTTTTTTVDCDRCHFAVPWSTIIPATIPWLLSYIIWWADVPQFSHSCSPRLARVVYTLAPFSLNNWIFYHLSSICWFHPIPWHRRGVCQAIKTSELRSRV